MMLFSALLPLLTLARALTPSKSSKEDSFHESLTLHPLPDGKLSVLFEFTTYFTSKQAASKSIGQSHHTLTPPALLLPLEHHDVAELTISFVSGQWNQLRSGEAGPLQHESGGGGGEVRGWLKHAADGTIPKEAWTRVTHALGGLFCAGLGPTEDGESVNTLGHIYPPHGHDSNMTHFYLPQPTLHLCTENLTPFLNLLPSKGVSGLSSLLAQPGLVFSWGFKTEGIEVIMPTTDSQGRWRGWWEGVVDLVPLKGGNRAFTVSSLFRKTLPVPFPEADTSQIRFIMPSGSGQLLVDGMKSKREELVMDGVRREVLTWDLLDPEMLGTDLRFRWENEGEFRYPRTFKPPDIQISRTVTQPYASDGTFSIRIQNHGAQSRSALYTETWPWWVKGWLHEIRLVQEGIGPRPDLLTSMFRDPSKPPTVSTTTLHLSLTLPARSSLHLTIPFTKQTLKYTEHRPDAERGREIPSGILTILDDESSRNTSFHRLGGPHGPAWSSRRHLYTSRQLLDLPTPDFSMPYNVIIMTSTVMAIFFGLMHGALTRPLGWVQVPGRNEDVPRPLKNGDTARSEIKINQPGSPSRPEPHEVKNKEGVEED